MKLIEAWWRKNRDAAPTLFADELAESFEKVSRQPDLGVVHEVVRGNTFRRVLLRKTQQHVFYVVDDANGVIVIHTIWGARRAAPKL